MSCGIYVLCCCKASADCKVSKPDLPSALDFMRGLIYLCRVVTFVVFLGTFQLFRGSLLPKASNYSLFFFWMKQFVMEMDWFIKQETFFKSGSVSGAQKNLQWASACSP